VGAITIVDVHEGNAVEHNGCDGTDATWVGSDGLECSGDWSESYNGGLRCSSVPKE